MIFRNFTRARYLSVLALIGMLFTFISVSGCTQVSDDIAIQETAEDFIDADSLKEVQNTMTLEAGQNLETIWKALQALPDNGEKWHTASIGNIEIQQEFFARASVQRVNETQSDSQYATILLRRVGDAWLVYGLEIVSSPQDKLTINFEKESDVLSLQLGLMVAGFAEEMKKSQ